MMILYPYGLRKALTLSYDDGVETDIELIRILDEYGILATFNLNSGCFAPRRHGLPCRHDSPPHERIRH